MYLQTIFKFIIFRALCFLTEVLLRFARDPQIELKSCFHDAYNNSLSKYHGWAQRNMFSLAIRFLPSKEEFLEKLTNNLSAYSTENQILIKKQVKNT